MKLLAHLSNHSATATHTRKLFVHSMRMVTERLRQNVERDINVNIYIQLGTSENFVFNSAIHRKEHGISNINYNTLLLHRWQRIENAAWKELNDNNFQMGAKQRATANNGF